MKGFLSEGLRDVVAILGLIVGITQLFLAFKPRLRGLSFTLPSILPGSNRVDLFAALKRCWNDANNDARPTLMLVALLFVINALIVLIFNVANEAVVGFVLLKDIGLAYLIGEVDGWLKGNATRRDLHLFRALVATVITIVLIVPPYFLGFPSTENNRFQSLYLVEAVGFMLMALMIIGAYLWQGIKFSWKLLTG